MICKPCGKEIPNNSNFCPFCGSKIDFEDTFSNSCEEIHEPTIEEQRKIIEEMAKREGVDLTPASNGWIFFGIFFPLISFILFYTYIRKKPDMCIKIRRGIFLGIIIRLCLSLIFNILFPELFI